LIMSSVSDKALQSVVQSKTAEYFKYYYKNEKKEGYHDIQIESMQEMRAVVSVDQYIASYTIIPDKGEVMYDLKEKTKFPKDFYKEFVKSPEGKYFTSDKSVRNGWLGYHSYIDKYLDTDSSKYFASYYQRIGSTESFLIFDVKMDVIKDQLMKMDFGEGSYTGVISPDGREVSWKYGDADLYSYDGSNKVIANKNIYVDNKDTKDSVTKTVKLDGQEYFFICNPIGESGMLSYALIPTNNLLSKVSSIKNISWIMVVIAAIIAFLTGYIISNGISKTLKKMSEGLNTVADGDLTNEFKTNRKDEFKSLTETLNVMLSGIRNVLVDVQKFSSGVNELAMDVSNETGNINEAIHKTSDVVGEVVESIKGQGKDIQKSDDFMVHLSDSISKMNKKTSKIESSAEDAIEAIGTGRGIVKELNDKSESAVAIARTLVGDIKDVQKNSEEIEDFVQIINDISEETNLLSLNASIEAAKAGPAGAGFAVVAEQIRRLADQSRQASDNIRDLVKVIDEKTNKTAESVKQTDDMITSQANLLDHTVEVFEMIKGCVDSLVENITATVEQFHCIDSEKEELKESITNIYEVSKKINTSSQEVVTTLNCQKDIIDQLTKKADRLTSDTAILDESIDRFTI